MLEAWMLANGAPQPEVLRGSQGKRGEEAEVMANKQRIKGLSRLKLTISHGLNPWTIKPECHGCHDRVPVPLHWRFDASGMQRCSACLLLMLLQEIEKSDKEEHS